MGYKKQLNDLKSHYKSRFITYEFSIKIPKEVFTPLYPANPSSFAEKLRKSRMDHGLRMKDLSQKLGVDENTIFRWEVEGVMPTRRNMAKVEKFMAG